MSERKIYIAGPMRGFEFYNFPAFDVACDKLAMDGWAPVSPADLDREKGFDETDFPEDHDWNEWASSTGTLEEIIHRDYEAIKLCDAIYMLEGWDISIGARAEKGLAEWFGLDVYYEEEEKVAAMHQRESDESILEEALRITQGARQSNYGHPQDNFLQTAKIWEAILDRAIEIDGDGKPRLNIPPRFVALCMIGVKISRETNKPNRDNWVDSAGYSGCGSMCE